MRPPTRDHASAAAIVLILAVVLPSCGPSPEELKARAASERRIEQVLAIRPPFRLLWVGIDDCGVRTLMVAGGGGDTLAAYADNRTVAVTPEMLATRLPPWHVWLDAPPESAKGRELAFGSPAESAVVDLVRLTLATNFEADEESAIVRGERLADLSPHPGYEHSVLESKWTPRQKQLRQLMSFRDQIEWRRNEALRAP